jgi:hypothetical protein
MSARAALDTVGIWLPFFPLLAAGIGFTLALSAWNWDHRLGHVYALSLPLTRMEYTLLKMGAGAALCLIPAGALWLGAHVATAAVALPAGLHAYPDQLALRFSLAVLMSYSVLFAMAAGTVKTTVSIISVALALLVIGTIGSELFVRRYELLSGDGMVESVLVWLLNAPGPLEVFGGSWSLIDV